jgi:hypothetical protein
MKGGEVMYHLLGRDFINMIKTIYPQAKTAAGSTEVIVRCPFCGDSKIQSHAHMYISVPVTVNDLSFYDCKKCPAHGVVDDEFLRKIGCLDTNVLVAISKHNSDVMKLPKYKTLKSIDIYPLKQTAITDNKFTRIKLDYINKRIGANFTFGHLISLKIFLNLYDVVGQNRLQLTRDQGICNQLSNSFIGFISYDNSFATMRRVFNKNLIKSIDKRYINYHLVEKLDDGKNFYVIPTNINFLSMERIKIHITEGVFDILSVFYNINACNTNQNIYIASGGKSYKQALQFVLTEFGVINYEIHLYPDNDVSDDELNRLVLYSIQILPSNIYIHRNIMEGEKDFGVQMDRIKESTRMIGDLYG